MDDGAKTPPTKEARIVRGDGHTLRTHYSTGHFIIPDDNTWAAHSHYIKAARDELGFSPERYDYFDGVVAAKIGNPALTDPKHADYARYEAMRSNIAVIRNYVLSHYEESGEFKKTGSRAQIPRITSIAEALGQALANDKWGTRVFTRSTSIDVANIEGVGAMEMYKHLLELQEPAKTRQPLITGLKNFLALPDRDWLLPPLDQSPFSPEGLAAAPPGYVSTPLPKTDTSSDTYSDSQQREETETKTETKQEKPAQQAEQSTGEKDPVTESIELSEKIVATVNKLQSIETLAEIPREESVEEARKILRNLRNLEFTDRSMEEYLDQGTPTAVVAKKQAFNRLVNIFAAHLKQAQNNNPSIQKDPAVQAAIDTSATMALELAEHTRRMLADEDEREARLNQLIDSLPPTAELRITLPVDRILETMELGLEHACGKELNTTTLERLLIAEERLEQHSILLRNQTEEEPSREESLEHARSVLRRMQDLPYGESTLQEFIDNGKPEDKAAFAQQVEEMVGIYRNLKVESTHGIDDATKDPRVKDAEDAIQGFAHAVKLMAAKEMPNSIASAQQISAADATEPQAWKDLSHHTVNRLIKSAEGELEKALDIIAQDADEQDEDVAQDLIDSALNSADQGKRKKRRRGDAKARPKAKSSGKKNRKKVQDLTADDYVLKQGRFAEDAKDVRREANPSAKKNEKETQNRMSQEAGDKFTGQGRFADPDSSVAIAAAIMRPTTNRPQQQNQQPGRSGMNRTQPPQGLKESDLAAIAKLGGSLRTIGNQAQGISVSSVDKVAPDNRTQPKPNEINPRNQQGPSKG